MNPTIQVSPNSSDTGLLENMTSAGKTALGVSVGAVGGYAIGRGKLIPTLLGAGLGYVLLNTGIIK